MNSIKNSQYKRSVVSSLWRGAMEELKARGNKLFEQGMYDDALEPEVYLLGIER